MGERLAVFRDSAAPIRIALLEIGATPTQRMDERSAPHPSPDHYSETVHVHRPLIRPASKVPDFPSAATMTVPSPPRISGASDRPRPTSIRAGVGWFTMTPPLTTRLKEPTGVGGS